MLGGSDDIWAPIINTFGGSGGGFDHMFRPVCFVGSVRSAFTLLDVGRLRPHVPFEVSAILQVAPAGVASRDHARSHRATVASQKR